MRVQMLGLCRFSYVGLRGYQRDHTGIEERRAFLYDPARLARRWLEAAVARRLLGGIVGVGTVVYAVAIGPLTQALLPKRRAG